MNIKLLILSRFMILAIVLFALNLINWRDALLIITAPIALYHALAYYLYIISKQNKNAEK